MKKKGVSSQKVAATYIGTVVGAGFATGQEILQFFVCFGVWGLAALFFATLLFVYFGLIIMDLGSELQARSHLKIVRYAGGKIIGAVIDGIIVFFLFGAVTAMIAGTGALFEQHFHLPALLGNMIMALLTAITVLGGINRVINSISFVVPFLLLSVVGISVYAVWQTPPDIVALPREPGSGLIGNWFLSAILYVSYNIILAIAVLGPLGFKAKDRKAVRHGAVLGGTGLGLGALLIYLAISSRFSQVSQLEVPMVFIADQIAPLVQITFAVVLIAEIYTTAVGSLYGFTARIIDLEASSRKAKLGVVAVTVAALLASQLGFSNLVKYMYSLVGYAGIIMLLSLVYGKIRSKNKPSSPKGWTGFLL